MGEGEIEGEVELKVQLKLPVGAEVEVPAGIANVLAVHQG